MTIQKELIPMLPGDLLRHEREQQGLSIEKASAQSRIRLAVINSIESGETSDIPSVYLRGYIRNYARFLGMDPADVEGHMHNVQGAEPEVRTVFTVNTNRGRAEKWLKTSSYLAASALIAALAWQFTHEAVRFSQGESRLNSVNNKAVMPVDGGTTAAEPDRRPANTHLSASIASVEVLNQGSKAGGNSVAEQAWAAIGGQTEAGVTAVGQHRLAVMTSADTWVEIIDADGQQLEMDLIRAGTTRDYSGQGPFRIMIGRASAIELTMDGQVVDLGPHTRGNVARMTLGAALAADSGQPAETESR